MIKNMIKKTLLYFSIITLVVYLVSFLFFSKAGEYALVLQILVLSVVLVLAQQLMAGIKQDNYLIGMVAEYFAISVLVLLYGYFVGWFVRENWYLVFGYVAVVYIIGILLDLVRVKKDVDYINSALQEKRKDERREENK